MAIPVGAIIGAGATLASTLGVGRRAADKRQVEQQRKLNDVNAKTSKELADYEQQLRMKMWQDTNYGAQLNEAEKAGVSKAAAIGGAGGGTQGASVSGVSGTGAASGVEGQRVQNEQLMMMAQIANMNADTKLKTANAEKVQGVDTDSGKQGIEESKTRQASLMQGITNAKAQEGMIKVETRLKEIEEFEQKASQGDRLDYIEYATKRAISEFENVANETFINVTTRSEKIKMIKAEAVGAVLKNELTKAQAQGVLKGVEVSDAQIRKMAEDIAQGWEGLKQGDGKLAIEKFNGEIKANYPSIMNVIGRGIDDTIDTIFGMGDRNRKVHKRVD